MPSHQNSAPGSKSAKFVAANPLAPMADPFAGMGDDEKEYQKELSDNLNKRMTKTLEDMAARGSEADHPDRAPTGSAYKAAAQAKAAAAAVDRQRTNEINHRLAMKEHALKMENKENEAGDDNNDDNDNDDNASDGDSDDDEYDDLLNDDSLELDAIRQRRINQMRAAQAQAAQHRALGHGEVRTITQDEFLPECTGSSEWVAVHFYHKEFERCKIMDHHLAAIAPQHMDCKFLRLDAEKAPFFVHKLQIKTLPCLIVFQEGKAIDRLEGFAGLAIDESEPDKWHTGRLQKWISETGAIKYRVPTEEIKEEMRRMGIRAKGTVWSGTSRNGFSTRGYDSDDE